MHWIGILPTGYFVLWTSHLLVQWWNFSQIQLQAHILLELITEYIHFFRLKFQFQNIPQEKDHNCLWFKFQKQKGFVFSLHVGIVNNKINLSGIFFNFLFLIKTTYDVFSILIEKKSLFQHQRIGHVNTYGISITDYRLYKPHGPFFEIIQFWS